MEATVSDPESEHLSRRPPRLAWWPAVLPLLLMLISDDKLRLRPPEESIAGQADRTVVVEIAVYVCVAIYLYLRFGLRPPRRRATILTVLAWLFAGYAALSALWSPYPGPAVVRAAQLLITASLAHVIATRARVEELHRFAHAFVVAVLLSVGIGVVHPFRRLPLMQDRFNWLYVHQVVVGIYLAIAVLVVTAYLTRRGDQTRARLWSTGTYVVILAILVSALIATGTRGAAVGCAAGLVVMLATSRGPRGRAEMIIMAIPVAVIVVLSLSDKILAFMTRGETAEQLESLNSRTELWSLAMDAVHDRPLFGWGMSAARGIFYDEIGLGGGHNAFVNVLVDGGFVGLLIFVLLLLELAVQLIARARRREARADAGMLLGLVTLLVVDGLTAEMMATTANVASVWLFVAIAWTRVLGRPAPGRPHQPVSPAEMLEPMPSTATGTERS
jgi:exopolysaccharide production protein ExoQ